MKADFSELWHEIASPVTVIAWSLDQLQINSQAGQLTTTRVGNILAPALESVEYLEKLIAAARQQHQAQSHFHYLVGTPQHVLVADAPAIGVARVRLGEVLERVVKMISPRIEKLGVQFVPDWTSELGRLVLPDSSTTWQEVLLNLLGNALDAVAELKIGKSRELRLTAQKDGDFLVLRVTDTGPGIPEDLLPQIFTQHISTKGVRGSGLGLKIVRDLVENELHGEITMWSKPDQGTCFELLIPLLHLKCMSFHDKNDIPCKK